MNGLPEINATLNAIATVLIVAGLVAIYRDRPRTHRALMSAAFGVSILFLITYVTNRILAQGVHTPFAGGGSWRTFYYWMLGTHVVLAMAVPVLAIRTIWLAISGSLEKHRFWARITYPIWLYVSVTGVLVYFFLYQWF
jgi:putative membrane protein